MTRDQIDERAESQELELVTVDGFDDCIMGICERFNQTFVVYDQGKVVKKLMENDGMDREDALEWLSSQMIGSWLGDGTPGFVEVE